MINQKELFPQKLAQKWPLKALNFFPYRFQEKFIWWRTNKNFRDLSFDFPHSFKSFHSAVIFLPDNWTEFYLSIPLINLICQVKKAEVWIVGHPKFEVLIQSMFPNAKTLPISEAEMFFREPQFLYLQKCIKQLKPTLSLQLNSRRNLIEYYLQRLTQASLRIGIDLEANPYDNIGIETTLDSKIIWRYKQIAELFTEEGLKDEKQLVEIKANEQNIQEILRELSHFINLSKNKLVCFLWDTNPALKKRQMALIDWLQEFFVKEEKLTTKLIAVSMDHHQDAEDIPMSYSEKFPCFRNVSYGKFIALVHQSNLSLGLDSPALHLANLCQQSTLGVFSPKDMAHDSRDLFGLFSLIEAKNADEIPAAQLKKAIQTELSK